MTKYEIKPTTRFRKDVKLIQKRGFDIQRLTQVIGLLIANALSILIGYWFTLLNRTGSHSDLF